MPTLSPYALSCGSNGDNVIRATRLNPPDIQVAPAETRGVAVNHLPVRLTEHGVVYG